MTTVLERPQKICLPRYEHLKLILDITFAAILLIVLAPLYLLVALLIRLDSAGPTFYRQTRVGKGGRSFTIIKFRTMTEDAPCLSTEDMQRQPVIPVTRMGRFLRKTSLDELPQLINILKGEMSFIGPRPALPSQDDVNRLRIAMGIEHFRPGITGWAQVNGRDALDTDRKVHYDTEYCRSMSLWMDLKVFFLTVIAIMTSRGNR